MSKKQSTEVKTHEEYFKLTKEYKKQYGDKTLLLMQVGAFFEIYGMKDSSGEIIGSNMVEIAEICQLNISDKKITYNNCNLMMAGFRDYTLDKYLVKLTDNGYTVPVYVQEKEGKDVIRKLDKIYSTGSYLSCDIDTTTQIANNIMCIWMETYKPISKTTQKNRDSIVYGVSVVNIFTGKSTIFQYETTFYMATTTFDELERFVTIYSPSEVIIISPFDNATLQTIIQFIGLSSPIIHRISNTDNRAQNSSNQKYVKQILSTFYGAESYDICSEFHSNQTATQSLCFLLNFIQEHNPSLVEKISLPEFNNTSERMILANHTLIQLNIIGDSSIDGKKFGSLSSVSSFLNKTCSSMGRRKFHYQITNPTFNEVWLNKEYEITNIVLKNYHFVDFFRKQLSQMRDIEKICRQMVSKKVYPSSIYYLYNSVYLTHQMNVCLAECPEISNYLCNEFLEIDENEITASFHYIENVSKKIMEFIDSHLVMDSCKLTSSMNTFDENIIRRGVSNKLDDTVDKYAKSKLYFQYIQIYFNGLMKQVEKGNTEVEYVKVHETEKSGVCLQMTKKRSQTLEGIIKTILTKTPTGIININDELTINLKEVKFIKSSNTCVDIDFPLLNEICKDLLVMKDLIDLLIAKAYLEFLLDLESTFLVELNELSQYIAKIDVMQSKAYIAKQYNYCCPIIISDNEKSFIEATDLRHVLIEHIQQNEIYVTNDIILGKNGEDIINVFGTNAVGKTSFIRAIGISIIMAQTGMFVPCSRFQYKPYTAIFSRILGNDNIFKGLSTFAVEMSELRVILKMADENSLILGDELCSGTEMESALSIFVAGLIKLHDKRVSAIFATHFHEIVNYDEIKSLDRLKLKHMEVVYDREKDCLIYERKLKNGSGPRIYGLEVCKSLYLEQEFLELAYSIRNKHYPESRGELSNTTSIYNANKIRGKCESCGEHLGEEIHHLKHQREADENGFIGSFHKNHPANLLSVCKNCHDKFHKETESSVKKKSPTVRKKTTDGKYLLV